MKKMKKERKRRGRGRKMERRGQGRGRRNKRKIKKEEEEEEEKEEDDRLVHCWFPDLPVHLSASPLQHARLHSNRFRAEGLPPGFLSQSIRPG